MTVIGCAPTASELAVNAAWAAPSSDTVPRVVAPSWNVAVPVGVPTLPLMVAVNVTASPKVDGFCDELTVVVDAWALTVSNELATPGTVPSVAVKVLVSAFVNVVVNAVVD